MGNTRKLVTIPEATAARLSREINQSRVVAQALQNYYDSKDSVRDLSSRLESMENKLEIVRRAVSEIKQVSGLN